MRAIRLALAMLMLSILMIAGVGLVGAVQTPRVVAYSIDDPHWPSAKSPLRIVQLSDMHAAGPDMPVTRVKAIVAQVNALRPDLVMITGDLVSDKAVRTATVSSADAVAPYARLRARLGVFAVLGNHDHWRDGQAILRGLEAAGVRVLQNEAVLAGPITVAGVDDDYTGRADVRQAMAAIDGARPAVMISHSPDIFPQIDRRISVTLAGHTHGGQIALPFVGPVLTASRFGKRYVHGHIVEDGRHLVVSAGVGTSILPLRLGVPPEIVLVTLR